MTKKITLRKLASDLEVAPATVLRALSGHPHVRPELRRRIVAHAAACGYELPERRTGNIAVITESLFFCPYLSSLLSRLCWELHENGFHCCICDKSDIEYLNDYMLDGVISTTWTEGFEKSYPKLHSLPFVSLNSGDNLQDNVYMVSSDNYGAVTRAMQHLYDGGCRRILLVMTFPVENRGSNERLQAFNDFCTERNIPGEKEGFLLRISNNWKAVLKRMAELEADAVFCASERDVTELYHGIRQMGLRVPEDVSVICFSSGESDRYMDPPLTVLKQDFQRLAQEAVKMLKSRLAGEPIHASVRVPLEFIPRKSVRRN
ncbi:MAG: LacI family DNA-binding transcriptional regulator [Lentisphaeria bacterium]|nr:LacI family DNA-binding transcriptional regulator [Lentisphaeria bacterium]